jgi:hypothetical protein
MSVQIGVAYQGFHHGDFIGVFEVDLPGASCEVPFWSSHDTSAIAKRAVLSSALIPSMLSMIGKKSTGLTSYWSVVVQLTRTKPIGTSGWSLRKVSYLPPSCPCPISWK